MNLGKHKSEIQENLFAPNKPKRGLIFGCHSFDVYF